MKLGFVTCDALAKYFPSSTNPLFTHDDEAAATYLRAHGVEVVPVLWGTSVAMLREQNFTALVMRSPWNYSANGQQSARFVEWMLHIKSCGITMINDPELMRWNLDKRYLGHLADANVAVMPTRYILPNDDINWYHVYQMRGPFVIKPAVGAGGKDLKRFISKNDVNPVAIDELRHNRTFLLQPYARDIEELGEWSLVYFDGSYSHAVHKKPGAQQWLVQDELGGSVLSQEPPFAAKNVADMAMASLSQAYFLGTGERLTQPTYARVDVMTLNGHYVVSELELVEPELFFLSRKESSCEANTEAIENFRCALMRALSRSI